MIILWTGQSSIILGFPKILELSLINCPHRAIALDCLNMSHLILGACQPLQTPQFYIYLGFYHDPPDGYIIKPSHPLVFPATFDFIFLCSSACFVRCLVMSACLQPIIIHIALESMNPLRWTHYNYTGTTPTSYHKVYGLCDQT